MERQSVTEISMLKLNTVNLTHYATYGHAEHEPRDREFEPCLLHVYTSHSPRFKTHVLGEVQALNVEVSIPHLPANGLLLCLAWCSAERQ